MTPLGSRQLAWLRTLPRGPGYGIKLTKVVGRWRAHPVPDMVRRLHFRGLIWVERRTTQTLVTRRLWGLAEVKAGWGMRPTSHVWVGLTDRGRDTLREADKRELR